jgi:hypothetical protein
MSDFIDPPAPETAEDARKRYEKLQQRLKEQKSLRKSLRSAYKNIYEAEILAIKAMKAKLNAEKTG